MTEPTTEEVREALGEALEDGLTADGFDEALVGWVQVFGNTTALYDRAKCIDILIENGATPEEAEEHFDFNVAGSFVGPATPAFATILRRVR